MLSCREVTQLVASDALADAGWRTRIGVRLHQAMCRHCRRYARQLRAMGEAMRALAAEEGRHSTPALERVMARIPPRDQ